MSSRLHDWPEGLNLQPLILSLYGTISPRKQRLAAVAFCRRIARLMPDEGCLKALAVAERYADREVGRTELTSAHRDVQAIFHNGGGIFGASPESIGRYAAHAAVRATHPTKRHFADSVADQAAAAVACTNVAHWTQTHHGECAAQLRLLRDILGPATPTPKARRLWLTWNDGLIPKLARAIYEERLMPEGSLDPTRLAVLADALEEAGCNNTDILAHCRDEGPHLRGCWVVDLLLGKK